MKTPFALRTLILSPLVSVLLASTAGAVVTIDYVTVGDAGNANDTTGFGGVAYEYMIGKYEVTNAQYAEFLNAVAATDTYSLYSDSMDSDVRGGITQNGTDGSCTYSVKTNMGDKPVNFVSFSDAMRFTNWINNGQGAATTESGAYDMTQAAETVIHASNATVWLPTENEWYKAAYYDPTLNTGAGGYWLYPTKSSSIPTVAAAGTTGIISNPGANVANYNFGADWNAQDGNVTTVGSAGATSYYGTFDQGGNVWEWNEAIVVGGAARGVRGGSWASPGSTCAPRSATAPRPRSRASTSGSVSQVLLSPNLLACCW
jgi:sulfatase modifying factor 1